MRPPRCHSYYIYIRFLTTVLGLLPSRNFQRGYGGLYVVRERKRTNPHPSSRVLQTGLTLVMLPKGFRLAFGSSMVGGLVCLLALAATSEVLFSTPVTFWQGKRARKGVSRQAETPPTVTKAVRDYLRLGFVGYAVLLYRHRSLQTRRSLRVSLHDSG